MYFVLFHILNIIMVFSVITIVMQRLELAGALTEVPAVALVIIALAAPSMKRFIAPTGINTTKIPDAIYDNIYSRHLLLLGLGLLVFTFFYRFFGAPGVSIGEFGACALVILAWLNSILNPRGGRRRPLEDIIDDEN